MKKTIKLLKLLLAITSCLFFYSCTESPAYFESASVTRTGGIAGSDNKAKNTKKPATYTNTSSKIKLLDSKYRTNGFMFMVEVPPNSGKIKDEYKGDWDTESCYMIVLVPYATGTAYKNPESSIFSQGAYEKAKAAFAAGKVK